MKKRCLLLIMLFLFPLSVFAYSDRIIVGGETIGIEVHSEGVYIVGFYPIQNKFIAKDAGFQKGDIIIRIDNDTIHSIEDINQVLTEEKEYQFTIERNNSIKQIPLKVEEDDYFIKTGLYVKDRINGIGTLSYIDPETKIYGSLGHEIVEKTSQSRFKLKEGMIYKAEVSSIEKSRNGSTGSKNAFTKREDIMGDVSLNELEGIFGKYQNTIHPKELVKVGLKEEIHNGKATIKTVIEKNNIEDFSINILALDESSPNKNILFEITDERLLKKTGGIIQGMSGSPIIQDNKIIGVVNYVIVDDTKKGYGIFITTMLEKGDELLS